MDALIFDQAEWTARLGKEAEKTLGAMVMRGGVLGASEVPIEMRFDVMNPRVEEFVSGYSYRFAAKINKTTADRLRKQLTEGINAGESTQQLRKRLLEKIPEFAAKEEKQRFYTEMIARTERARAQHAGRIEGWKQSGVVEAKQWKAFPDACAFCQEMEGRTAGLDETYLEEGGRLQAGDSTMTFTYEPVAHPPLHPNCRCALLAVLIEKMVEEAPAAEALENAVHKAEAEIATRETEKAIAFDKNGNRILEKAGSRNAVRFNETETEIISNAETFLHNHPSGQGFSPEDVRYGFQTGVGEMRVISEYRRYSLRGLRGKKAQIKYFMGGHEAINHEVRFEFTEKIRAGTLEIRAAEQAHQREVMKRFAERYRNEGIEYIEEILI